MPKQISVEGNGHCCHRPSSNWETNLGQSFKSWSYVLANQPQLLFLTLRYLSVFLSAFTPSVVIHDAIVFLVHAVVTNVFFTCWP